MSELAFDGPGAGPPSSDDLPPLIGESTLFLDVLESISRVAPLDRPVLVIGERGTGKELIVARLHYLSRRWQRAFVKMNCAAIAENLVESELFGHEAGAFTGPDRARAGRFEFADGGTLFLDEIAGASLSIQEKILRVVEYGEFERVGGNETIKVDVRVIGATNLDLPGEAARGRFRYDLLDRLGFDVITLPPLVARRGDVALLANRFAHAMTVELGWKEFAGFADAALAELQAHTWPGNVRELKNVVERAVYSGAPGEPVDKIVIDPFASPYRPAPKIEAHEVTRDQSRTADAKLPSAEPECADFKAAVEGYERRLIEQALAGARYNRREAADRLGLSYSQLRHLVRRHAI